MAGQRICALAMGAVCCGCGTEAVRDVHQARPVVITSISYEDQGQVVLDSLLPADIGDSAETSAPDTDSADSEKRSPFMLLRLVRDEKGRMLFTKHGRPILDPDAAPEPDESEAMRPDSRADLK